MAFGASIGKIASISISLVFSQENPMERPHGMASGRDALSTSMWQLSSDENGNACYYNYSSGLTQWDTPVEGFWDASSTCFYKGAHRELQKERPVPSLEDSMFFNTNVAAPDEHVGYHIPWSDITFHDNLRNRQQGVWKEQEVSVMPCKPGSQMVEEMKRLCSLGHHPAVVKMFGMSIDSKSMWHMITELPPCGLLDRVLNKYEVDRIDISDVVLLRTAMEICHGVEHLAMNSIFTGALATSTIGVFDFDPKIEKKLRVKLICHVQTEYGFPELSEASLVTSFGFVLLELWSKSVDRALIAEKKEHYIISGSYPPRHDLCPDGVYKLMQHCWQPPGFDRPSLADIRSELLSLYVQHKTNSVKETKDELIEANQCAVCMAADADATFVHGEVGHQACCYTCAKTIMDSSGLCPICNQKIEKCIRHFVS